jgi:hypothetical protein
MLSSRFFFYFNDSLYIFLSFAIIVFVSVVKAYIEVVGFINGLQVITTTATYKLLAGILCFSVFCYLALRMMLAYVRLDDSMETFNEKKFVLGKILEDEVHIAFINDVSLLV